MEANEKIEAKILLEKGVKFKGFTIKEPYLGTLDIIAGYNLEMSFDMESLESNDKYEANKICHNAPKYWALIVACLVLNNKWLIFFFRRILASYFKWRIKPSELSTLWAIVQQMMSMPTFIAATKLMSGVRTTKPNLVANETKKTNRKGKA